MGYVRKSLGSLASLGLAACLVHVCWLSLQAQALQAGSSYQRWLDEDVVYIIEDREREVFQRLQTDPERERFIEQFWERRDPSPGLGGNELKEEHYRRIAYSNQRYGSGDAGWRSDRGRIYVVHGPPDENESHPSGGRSRDGRFENPNPYEIWVYRDLPGVGRLEVVFLDADRSGRFLLQQGQQ